MVIVDPSALGTIMKSRISNFVRRLKDVFSLDLRSLALLRIGVGCVIILDLILRTRDLKAHYTDAGAIPRALVYLLNPPATWSFHLANGNAIFELILFLIAGILALLLIVGYRTKLVTFLSLVFLFSLQNRSPVLTFGGDRLLSATLLWGLFLPWGAVFSVDASRHELGEKLPQKIFSIATVAYCLQIVFLYGFSVIHKWGDAWVRDGTAIFYALSRDDFATRVGQFLLQFPEITKYLTFSAYWIEAIAPVLILFPLLNKWTRLLAVLLICSLQIGIGLSLQLGMFPFMSIVSTFGLITPPLWERLSKLVPTHKPIKLYYDDRCLFCIRVVGAIATFLRPKLVDYTPASHVPSVRNEMVKRNSWVVVGHDDTKKWQFNAFIELIGSSPLFFWAVPLLKWHPVSQLGNRIYRYLSAHFHLSCDLKEITPPTPSLSLRLSESILVGLLLIYTFWWSVAALPGQIRLLPKEISFISDMLPYTHAWGFFKFNSTADSGWYVLKGTLVDGSSIDLLRSGKPFTVQKPPFEELNPNERWQQVYDKIGRRGTPSSQQHYAKALINYYCSLYNAGQQTRVEKADLLYFRRTLFPNFTASETKARTISSYNCPQ
jgi:hypothetical protein